jgi:hypothetical protein
MTGSSQAVRIPGRYCFPSDAVHVPEASKAPAKFYFPRRAPKDCFEKGNPETRIHSLTQR